MRLISRSTSGNRVRGMTPSCTKYAGLMRPTAAKADLRPFHISAYVMNQSGRTGTLGNFLAQTGGYFALLSPILGWIGVAVTGSDTSANALFGALQVQTGVKAGLDPVLLAAANTSGGVLGKMISP